MAMTHQRLKGFTIVELLVVIVVIAILAAITVTAFNGVQQRAGNSARIAQASKMQKLIRAYVVLNGAAQFKSLLPALPTNSVCLGTGYKDVIPTGTVGCYVNGDTTYTVSSTNLDNGLRAVGDVSVSYPAIEIYVAPDTWAQSAPVLWYNATNTVDIDYVLQGDNATCSNGATNLGSNPEWGPSTRCRITLNLDAL